MSHAHSGLHDAHQELLAEWDSRPAADSGHYDCTMYHIKLCVMLDLTADRGLFQNSDCHTNRVTASSKKDRHNRTQSCQPEGHLALHLFLLKVSLSSC